MRYTLILSVFLFFHLSVYAQNCPDLASGKIIRIDKSGGSLEKFRAQDQDGMGICYANAASVILQSVLPNNPEVSYMQLATIEGAKVVEERKLEYGLAGDTELFVKDTAPKKTTTIENEYEKWQFAMSASSVCDTVLDVQKIQLKTKASVLCPKSKTNLEELFSKGDPEWKEFNAFLESSKYMNLFQAAFGDSNSNRYEKFNKSFSELVTSKKDEISKKTCKQVHADGLESLFHPILAGALEYEDCFKKKYQRGGEYWCKMSRAIASDASSESSHKIIAKKVNPKLLSNLQAILEKSDKNKFSLAQFKADFTTALIETSEAGNTELSRAFATEFFDEISTDKLNNLIAEFNEIKTTGTSLKCVDRLLARYLTEQNFEEGLQAGVLCEHKALLKQASAVVLEHDRIGLKDIGNVVDFIQKNAGLPYNEAMMSLYANDCQEKDKFQIPPDLKCENTSVTSKNKSSTDHIIFDNLSKNKAISMSFCSAIIDHQSFKEDDCGNHAVTIKGIKCVKGKYKYLILNSWGKDNVPKNPTIETELGTGSFWLDEKAFYDSVYRISTLNNGEKK